MCRATSTTTATTASSAPATPAPSPEKYWFINGKAYDLTKFADVHPGGLRNILLGQGRDATELFYSVHSTQNIQKATAVLDKFRCKEMDNFAPPPQFTFADDGLYKTLVAEANQYFKDRGISNKAPARFWIQATIQLILHTLAWIMWVKFGSYLAAAVASILSITIGFAIFHTASHSGLSNDWRVNDFWTWLWGDAVLGFFRPLWLVHHVWGHHSYTGIDRMDPDIANGRPFARKSPDSKWKPWFQYQWFTIYLVFLVAPGQWLGQLIQYYRAIVRLANSGESRIFGIPLKKYEVVLSESAIFSTFAVVTFFTLTLMHGLVFALTSLFLFSFFRGFMYWAIVFPNHETEIACHTHRLSDWGEQQIRHSSNFYMPLWLSSATGGMNYQIEHHLFPAVHPDHYPAMSEIVKRNCKKRNIPYGYYSSWFKSLASNIKVNQMLSIENPSKVKTHVH